MRLSATGPTCTYAASVCVGAVAADARNARHGRAFVTINNNPLSIFGCYQN